MFTRFRDGLPTTLSVKIAIAVTIAALLTLAVILVVAMSWTKPYYREQHSSSIALADQTVLMARK
jgi:hypothetical protein